MSSSRHSIDWFNRRKLFGSLGFVPPIEVEDAYYRAQGPQPRWLDSCNSVSGSWGSLHSRLAFRPDQMVLSVPRRCTAHDIDGRFAGAPFYDEPWLARGTAC